MRRTIIRNLTIAVSVLLGIVFIVFGIVLWNDRNKTVETNDDADVIKYDITTTGNGDIDPENMDSNEVGVYMNSDEFKNTKGVSNGIDVSKWQGKINWNQVKESGVDFAFIRIGYRGENGIVYKDDNADYNIQQAQKAGVLVGVYFFSTAVSEEEAKEEAEWTKQAIAGYSISYPVVYDCEGFSREGSRMNGLTVEERTNHAMVFLKNISDAGYDAMFYSSLSDAENSNVWDIAQIERDYKIWIAEYADVTYPEREKPEYDGKCHAWQYTNKGTVNGIEDKVDLVVCYFTKEKAEPKNTDVKIAEAAVPLTAEEKIYTSVNEKVTAKSMTNLRWAASTNSDIVVCLMNGEVVTRLGVGSNGWSKLDYNGRIVYAISSYLTTDLEYRTPDENGDGGLKTQFATVSQKVTPKIEVNLRKLPSVTNPDAIVIATAKAGEVFTRTGISQEHGWSRVEYQGQTLYCVSSYIEIVK